MVIYIVGLKLYVSSVLPHGVCDGFLSSSPRPFSRSTDIQTAQPDELTAPSNYERMDEVISNISTEIVAKVITFVLAHRLKRVRFGVCHGNRNVSLHLCVQNAVSAQPCVGKFRISLVLLNFLHCNFRLWFETP